MSDEIIRIKSLSDFVEQVNQIKLKSDILTLPPKLLFRGHSNLNYELIPSLGRHPSRTWMNSWQMVERDLIQTAQQKFPMLFPASDYPAILLAKLQHYGIYTRMLDLTDNALVALYFACISHQVKPETDGEIIAFATHPVSAYNPTVNAIADTYRLTSSSFMPADIYFYKVKQQQYYSSYLYPETKNYPEKALRSFLRSLKNPVVIEAGNICERQKHQRGYFLLFPNKTTHLGEDNCLPSKLYIQDSLVNIDKDDQMIVKKLIVPKELKSDLLDQLTKFGITDDFLFADSVDTVCKGIISDLRKHFP